MNTWKWLTIASAVWLTGSFTRAAALPGQTVIYSDFGSGLSYGTAVVWGVEGASVSGGYRGQAQFFTPSFNCTLSYIEMATYHKSGSPLSNFFLAQDDGSGAPGSIVESFTNVSTPTGLLKLNSVLDPVLTAGTQYWVCMEPGADSTLNGWFENNQNIAPTFAYERSEWGWTPFGPPSPPSGTFEVVAVPTPEPCAASLLVFGVIGLCGLRTIPSVGHRLLARTVDLH
jgi:hypothetical protein